MRTLSNDDASDAMTEHDREICPSHELRDHNLDYIPHLRVGEELFTRRFESGYAIDRPDLVIPESVVDDLTQPSDILLKPHLDAVWNAVGHPGSLNYDEHGRWREA